VVEGSKKWGRATKEPSARAVFSGDIFSPFSRPRPIRSGAIIGFGTQLEFVSCFPISPFSNAGA